MFIYTIKKHYTWQDIDTSYNFLLKRKDLNHNTLFNRLFHCSRICKCMKWNKIIGIWCLKQISKKYFDLLSIPKEEYQNYNEIWFFYTHPLYRNLGIAKHIEQKLIDNKNSQHIIAITKIDNFAMQKVLIDKWFIDTNKTIFNKFLSSEVKIYLL